MPCSTVELSVHFVTQVATEMKISTNDLQSSAVAASGFLKQLANEQRLMILCHLAEGEKSVSELQILLDTEQSSLSQHLAKLRKQGIIKARRNSQTKYYSIKNPNALKVIEVLYEIYCAPKDSQA